MSDIDKLFNEIESNMTVEQQLNYYKKLYELQQKQIKSQEEKMMRVSIRVSNKHLSYGQEEEYEICFYKLDDIGEVKQAKACYSQYECYTVYKMMINGKWKYIPYEDYEKLQKLFKEEK